MDNAGPSVVVGHQGVHGRGADGGFFAGAQQGIDETGKNGGIQTILKN